MLSSSGGWRMGNKSRLPFWPRCISFPTADGDGWLVQTINTEAFNRCHISPFLSPEENGCNQAIWIWSQSNELQRWSGGRKCLGYHSSSLERLCRDVRPLLHRSEEPQLNQPVLKNRLSWLRSCSAWIIPSWPCLWVDLCSMVEAFYHDSVRALDGLTL